MPATENVYFVTALRHEAQVRDRLFALVPEDDRFELAPDRWVVSYSGSTQELAESVGVRGSGDVIGNGLVLAITTYSGRAPTGLWDWFRKHGL